MAHRVRVLECQLTIANLVDINTYHLQTAQRVRIVPFPRPIQSFDRLRADILAVAAGIQGLKQVVSMLVELLVVAPPHEPPQVPDPRPICACLGGDHVVRAAAGPFPCRHRRGARELLRSGRAAGFCDRVERRLSPSVGRLRDNGRTYLIVHNAK